MSIPTAPQTRLSRDVSKDLLKLIKEFPDIQTITLERIHDHVEKKEIDQCIILGRRNGRNDTSYYLLCVASKLLKIYESQRGIGPRVWRRFETVINFLQDEFGDRLPINDIAIIIDKPL